MDAEKVTTHYVVVTVQAGKEAKITCKQQGDHTHHTDNVRMLTEQTTALWYDCFGEEFAHPTKITIDTGLREDGND